MSANIAPIDPARFAELSADLSAAESALTAAETAWQNETIRRSAAHKLRDQRRATLRAYVEECAGNKIANLP